MASLYEIELNRLLSEKKQLLALIQTNDKREKEAIKLRKEIEILESELNKYNKAMERFRFKPNLVSTSESKVETD